jgi:hypothetical protein
MTDYLSRLAQRSLSPSATRGEDRDEASRPWLRPRPTSRFEDPTEGDGSRRLGGPWATDGNGRDRRGNAWGDAGVGRDPWGSSHQGSHPGAERRDGSLHPKPGDRGTSPFAGAEEGTGWGRRPGPEDRSGSGRGHPWDSFGAPARDDGGALGSPSTPSHLRAGGDPGGRRTPGGDPTTGGGEVRAGEAPRTRRASHAGSLLPSGPDLSGTSSGRGPDAVDGGHGEGATPRLGFSTPSPVDGNGDRGGRSASRTGAGNPDDPERTGRPSPPLPLTGESGALLPRHLQDPALWAALRHGLQRRVGRGHRGTFPEERLDASREPVAPTVHVTIGRVEVRAASAGTGSSRTEADRGATDSGSSVLGLEEYLRLRAGGGRP